MLGHTMHENLVPGALLIFIILGVLGLRGLSRKIRIGFDAICFLAVCAYFLNRSIFPVFPPLNETANGAALELRALGGAWWFLGARLAVTALWLLHRRDQLARETRLFFDLAAAAIYLATAAVVLSFVFALPLSGVVATSGVVAIVLGLALQNTLADVFSGIAVEIEGPFRVGDRIQISDGIEGQVVQINWRSIRIQTDGDDIAIIPNSLIAKAQIVNRSFPTQRRTASVDLTCPNETVPERVSEALLNATLLCPDIVRMPGPSAHLTHLGARRSTYSVSFLVESTKELSSTRDLLLRNARRQLRYAGLLDLVDPQELATGAGTRDSILKLRLLQDAVLFECVSHRELEGVVEKLTTLRLEPGEHLFTEGIADASLYVVASGVLEITRRRDSGTERVGYIGAGEYIGEIGLLTGAVRAASATATTHCHIYRLDRSAIAPLLKQNTTLAAAFAKSAQHGLEILQRGVAAQAASHLGAKGQLLRRIRSYFDF
jgi:small-conductance mechanosensitive channel/CRP-like cAMP-binding protein